MKKEVQRVKKVINHTCSNIPWLFSCILVKASSIFSNYFALNEPTFFEVIYFNHWFLFWSSAIRYVFHFPLERSNLGWVTYRSRFWDRHWRQNGGQLDNSSIPSNGSPTSDCKMRLAQDCFLFWGFRFFPGRKNRQNILIFLPTKAPSLLDDDFLNIILMTFMLDQMYLPIITDNI